MGSDVVGGGGGCSNIIMCVMEGKTETKLKL